MGIGHFLHHMRYSVVSGQSKGTYYQHLEASWEIGDSLCSNPRIHATPLFHPTSLIYLVKTKSADWKLGLAQDKQVMMMITAPVIDLYYQRQLEPIRDDVPENSSPIDSR